jgi:hypothetical protein
MLGFKQLGLTEACGLVLSQFLLQDLELAHEKGPRCLTGTEFELKMGLQDLLVNPF